MTREDAILCLKGIKNYGRDTFTEQSDWQDSLDMAIKTLEQEPKWISVSERMPEPNRLVLCHITTGTTETYFLALWNDTQNAWEEGIGGYRLLENDLGYEVIKWMPLPKFYKAESNEVLDKIRAEILQLKTKSSYTFVNIDDVLRLIDKHMESENKE